MQKWDRRFEDEAHLKRRIQLIKSGQCQTHDQIDELFANETYEKMTYSELKEKERILERDKLALEEEKRLFETYIQETEMTLESLEAQIRTKKAVIEDTNLETVSLRKIKAVMTEIEKDKIDDTSYVCVLGWKDGKWSMKHFAIPRSQYLVVTEICNSMLLEESKKRKEDS
jgi:hypothetical protein